MSSPETSYNKPEELIQRFRSLVTDLLNTAPQEFILENEHIPGLHSLELYLRADNGQLFRIVRATRLDTTNPDANDSLDILKPKAVRYYHPYYTHAIQQSVDEDRQPILYLWTKSVVGKEEKTVLLPDFIDKIEETIRTAHPTYPAPFEYREGWPE